MAKPSSGPHLGQLFDGDYKLAGKSVWIEVGTLAVNIHRTDEGVIVDIWPVKGELDDTTLMATVGAMFQDTEDIVYNAILDEAVEKS